MKIAIVCILACVFATMTRAAHASDAVTVREVQDYVFGNYKGDFPSPPHADLNPKHAFIVEWRDRTYRLVFAHEGSYCPWIEFPKSGIACCFQFFEGNDGWAELFNNFGRQEHNSFVDIIERTPNRVWLRWTYFGVNMESGKQAYRATEDFYAYANGMILRRQSFESLMPGDHRGYAREPIELIGMSPVGKLWRDILRAGEQPNERHALCVLDAFSEARYDVYWTPKPDTVWDSRHRRAGSDWKTLDDARGVALVLPLKDAYVFCAFGDASGFDYTFTKLKEHTHQDTGGIGWGSQSWDHWPIGWLNSQAHPVDAESLQKYPNHFSPMGMDFFALPDEKVEHVSYWSLYGVAEDLESIRKTTRRWLEGDPKDPSAQPE